MKIKRIETDLLEIGYREYGEEDDLPIIVLHGFPYDINAFNETSEILSQNGCRVLTPFLRGFGDTKFKSELTMRSGQQAALAHDTIEFMNALHIEKAIIAGYDWGGRTACIVSAMWPDKILGLVSVGGYTIQNIRAFKEPLPPNLEQLYWYQYYFHSERGRKGLGKYRRQLCKALWTEWSPSWKFDDDTYEQTAISFDNPDFVDVVVHSYRHRYGFADGDKRYEETEIFLAGQPIITVPTIVLDPGKDGVVPLDGSEDYSMYFSEKYNRKVLQNIGHNLPQEAAVDFAQAILELKN